MRRNLKTFITQPIVSARNFYQKVHLESINKSMSKSVHTEEEEEVINTDIVSGKARFVRQHQS